MFQKYIDRLSFTKKWALIYRVGMFVLMLIFFFNTADGQVCEYRLSGHVEDPDTKEKMGFVSVSIKEKNQSVLTDVHGDFEIIGLCPGSYTLQVSHVDCESLELRVNIDKNKHLDLFLPHTKNLLKSVVLETKINPAATNSKTLKGSDLERTRGLSFSEALSLIPGIVLLQTGTNNAKPVVRGLHGNRVITVNNGIRQEGQQWGNEHAPEIDPFVSDKLTLLQGVEALRYGSDGIGGVIIAEARPLRFGIYSGRTELHSAYATNNLQYTISAIHERSFSKAPDWSFRIQSTFKEGGNAATPAYRLNNTGLKEFNASVAIGYKKNNYNSELFLSRFQTSIGIFKGAHIGNLSDLLTAIASESPDPVFLGQKTYRIERPRQEVTHLLGKWRHTLKIDKGKLQLLISGQQNNRKEYDIVRSSSNTKPQMDLQIATLNQELLIEKSPNKKTDIQIGLNAMQQQNTYTGRYFIPNFRAFSGGLFGLIKWSNTIWDIHSGFRIDNKYVNTSRLLLAGDTVSNRFNFTTSGASFFVQYKPPIAHDLVWSVQIGLNSRAPHVNELLSNGIHHGTATYEQGNTSLKPEKSSVMQTKVMYENHDHTLHAEVNGSFQLVRDFIYMTPQPDSPVLTNAGAFPRMVYRQTDARLLGADVLISLKLLKGLSSQLQGSTIRAYDLKQSTWLIMMPADRISNMLKYEFNFKKTLHDAYFSLEALHVWRQGRIPDPKSAIVDYKAPPDAYTLFHLHASATFHLGKHPVTAGFSLRNLLNTTYRDYLNQLRYFIDEPGRNLQIRIKYVIENTKNKNT